MYKKAKYFFILLVFSLVYLFSLNITTHKEIKTIELAAIKKTVEKDTPTPKVVPKPIALKPVKNSSKFKYRKYSHVTRFYKRLAKPVTDLCMQHKVPPAAVLSILSLESGWGKGYIGNITGNFLSLNATSKDFELPALTMPKDIISGKTILDSRVLANTPKENIIWEDRPPSLKKDYRPDSIAGTKENLDYFLFHPKELTKANLKNVRDFVKRFISKNSSIKAYREARILLDKAIEEKGIEVLFTDELNKNFLFTIGGRPHSYNFRPTWPKKVMSIYRNVGVNDLCKELYLDKKTFEAVW
ncbi:hypothetical protein [Wenyingzhuangia sp. IMCC45574]